MTTGRLPPLPEDWEQQDSIRGYALYLRLRRKRLRPGRRKPARAIEVTLPEMFPPRERETQP